MSFVVSCASVSGGETSGCPVPVWPDEKVDEELDDMMPYEGHEDFWAWMDQIQKLNEQLVVCRED